MNKGFSFLLLGSDKRQRYLYDILNENGYEAAYMNDEELEGYIDSCRYGCSAQENDGNAKSKAFQFNVILLPVSFSAMYFDKLQCVLNGNEYIFGCNLKSSKAGNFKCYEYMADDETAYKNAVATAEGTVAEAIIRSDININGSNCLITGYGRCARVIADRFKALNSNVTVIERIGHKRAEAAAYGYNAIDFNVDNYTDFHKYDYVINTVPHMVVDEQMLKSFNKNVTIIDIASKPGGVDYEYCNKHNINAVNALGLPGKYAPKTSAKILYDVICDKLK